MALYTTDSQFSFILSEAQQSHLTLPYEYKEPAKIVVTLEVDRSIRTQTLRDGHCYYLVHNVACAKATKRLPTPELVVLQCD